MKQITVKSQTVANLISSTPKDFQLLINRKFKADLLRPFGEKLLFAIVACSTVGVSKYSTIDLKESNKHRKLRIFFNPLFSVESSLHAEKGVEKNKEITRLLVCNA